jgi:hypothetical protein
MNLQDYYDSHGLHLDTEVFTSLLLKLDLITGIILNDQPTRVRPVLDDDITVDRISDLLVSTPLSLWWEVPVEGTSRVEVPGKNPPSTEPIHTGIGT